MNNLIVCPLCKENSSENNWDRSTKEWFGENDVVLLGEKGWRMSQYICPKCEKQSSGRELTLINKELQLLN